MPNEYSVEIHNHISALMEATQIQLLVASEAGETATERYCRGQLDELTWIRDFLRKNIDLKDFNYYEPVP